VILKDTGRRKVKEPEYDIMVQYRKPEWIKASVALIAMGSITFILFAVISTPFGDVLEKLTDEASENDMIVNEFFDVVNHNTEEEYTLRTTPSSIERVSVRHKRTVTDAITNDEKTEYYWVTVPPSRYTLVDATITIQSSEYDADNTQTQIKYVKGTVGEEITPLITMFQTVFSVVFAISMIGLITWFFLGSHEEEHEQYIQERKRPPGGSEQW
jgi:FlaG/FlaF family flagellin (archaellin)